MYQKYVFKYRLLVGEKIRIVSVTLNLYNNSDALKLAQNFESKGNFVEEVYNKDTDVTLYNYKKPQNKIAL